jgi:Tfp pilus assembly protein PilF
MQIKEKLFEQVGQFMPGWIVDALRELQPEFRELTAIDARLQIGGMYARRKMWGRASEQFQKVLDADPNNAAAIEWIGKIPRESRQSPK